MSFKRDDNGKFVATKHFKLPRRLKYILSSIGSADVRNHMKGLFVQATMQSFEVPEKKKKNPLTGKTEVVSD